MIIFGTCVGEPDRYRQIALPHLRRIAAADDLVVSAPGDHGIAHVYNDFIDQARAQPDCEALVLLHEDVEIIDTNFSARVRRVLSDPTVGVAGAVGAADLANLKWWQGRKPAGMVYETSGPILMGQREADVDTVDGLLMVVGAGALQTLRFDERSFPLFHGYDVDFCLQARDQGLRVVVTRFEVLHRTKTGYGDKESFAQASSLIGTKWPTYVRPASRFEIAHSRLSDRMDRARHVARRGRRGLNRAIDSARRSRPRESQTNHHAPAARTEVLPHQIVPESGQLSCVACRTEMACPPSSTEKAILQCPNCGTGTTWPPPAREVESSGLFDEMYGGTRLARRETWFREARTRLAWLQLYAPDGVLLELGCGTGEFLAVADAGGYESYGVETSEWAASHARELVPDVVSGILDDWVEDFPGMSPDIVAMWHVLEHIPDPLAVLTGIHEVLEPSGCLVLEVPNFESSAARTQGVGWDAAQLDDHCYHYTSQGLTVLLESAGFEVSDLVQFSSRIYGSVESWHRDKNRALLDGTAWPSLDFIRAIAHKARSALDPVPESSTTPR